jgi:hypothetical protein
MISQTTMPTNIGIPISIRQRLPIDQNMTTRSIIGVQIVSLMRLRTIRFFSKIIYQRLHSNILKSFKQTLFLKIK